MKDNEITFSSLQQKIVVQRLTVTWAFAESCFGGIMHILKIPFTGLVIGGFAVTIITLIAQNAQNISKEIFKSLIIVLLVKATISPYTPFTAYVAVSFQAMLAIVLFKFLNLNAVSIFILSMLAMIESAIQKLLMLTFFFGKSMWNAVDIFFDYVCSQFNFHQTNGSLFFVGLYIAIYIVGGIGVALFTIRILKRFSNYQEPFLLPKVMDGFNSVAASKHNLKKRLISIYIVLSLISIFLMLFNTEKSNAVIMVLRMFFWTTTAIVLWYFIITPLLVKLVLIITKKSKIKYNAEVVEVIAALPLLKKITIYAWENSKAFKGFSRLANFAANLLYWSIVYVDNSNKKDEHSNIF